jgi:hypothetical protein
MRPGSAEEPITNWACDVLEAGLSLRALNSIEACVCIYICGSARVFITRYSGWRYLSYVHEQLTHVPDMAWKSSSLHGGSSSTATTTRMCCNSVIIQCSIGTSLGIRVGCERLSRPSGFRNTQRTSGPGLQAGGSPHRMPPSLHPQREMVGSPGPNIWRDPLPQYPMDKSNYKLLAHLPER